MHILTLNPGSATLKFALFSSLEGASPDKIFSGKITNFGDRATVHFSREDKSTGKRREQIKNMQDAVEEVVKLLKSERRPDAVGVRVVHGGDQFTEPVLLDDAALAELSELSSLAPLHNPPALETVEAVKSTIGADIPIVGVFDTMFHRTLPPQATGYALPSGLVDEHGIRRYGFHGLAHEYMLRRYSEIVERPQQECSIITLQLGSGCSACAIKEGRSVDTSMGFTPLEGLVMRTRSGDIDPGILLYLLKQEKLYTDELGNLFNNESGLAGLTGTNGDMRTLLTKRDEGEDSSAIEYALDLFTYRVRKYLGAYLAALNGAEAVIFGGGIGEHSAEIRGRILRSLDRLGIILDEKENSVILDKEGRISTPESEPAAYVIPVDESVLIAELAMTVIETGNFISSK